MAELYAGTGVLSKRFAQGGWETEEIEITKGKDALKWEPIGDSYDLLWSGVPCNEYSGLAYDYERIWRANRTLWLRSLELVPKAKPRLWIIENVKMAQWIWGKAPYHYGPFFLWGYFHLIGCQKSLGQRAIKERISTDDRETSEPTRTKRQRKEPDIRQNSAKRSSKPQLISWTKDIKGKSRIDDA